MIKYTEWFGRKSKIQAIGCGFTGSRARLAYRMAVRAAMNHSYTVYEYLGKAEDLMLALYEFDTIDFETYNQIYLLHHFVMKIYDRTFAKEVYNDD